MNLELDDGHAVTLVDSASIVLESSRATVFGGRPMTEWEVEDGRVQVSGSAKARSSLDIGLPSGVAGVRGTVFTLSVQGDRALVSLHQGAVRLDSEAGTAVDFVAGQGAILSSTGPEVRVPPDRTEILSPDPGAAVTTDSTLLTWAPVTRAATYAVEFARDVAFTEILARVEADGTQVVIPTLTEDLPVFVRVIAVTGEGLEGPPSVERTLHVRLQATLGRALQAAGDADGSIAAFQPALPNYQLDNRLLKDLGWALYLAGRHEGSRSTYEAALAQEPEDQETLLEIGRVYFWLQLHEESADAYQRALNLSPDDADVLWGLGDTYRLMGRTDEAMELVERALALAPDHPNAGETLELLRQGG